MISKIWTGTLLFLACMFFCAWLVLVCREKNVHPLRDFAMFLKKQTKTGRIIFGSLFIALWVFASVKPGDGLRNANTTRTITVADFERGFVQTRVGTGEQLDFTPPPNATIVSAWWAFGAETDWIYVAFTNWAFRVATNDVERLRIYAFGKIEPFIREADNSIATNYWFAPFMASLGVVPQTNWNWLAGSDTPSQVWYAITPENSLVMTWQNALLDCDTDKPLSFQIEFKTMSTLRWRMFPAISRYGFLNGMTINPRGMDLKSCWTGLQKQSAIFQ